MISFVVEGESVSQGSLTAVPTNRNWRSVPGVRWTVKDAKPALKPWRKKVAAAASEAMEAEYGPFMGDRVTFAGPVHVNAVFVFGRPASHFGTGKNAERLKTDAPDFVTSHQKGDLDKHIRAVLDALTGTVIGDDSQVSSVAASKVYGRNSYIMVEVTPEQPYPFTLSGGGN